MLLSNNHTWSLTVCSSCVVLSSRAPVSASAIEGGNSALGLHDEINVCSTREEAW